MKKEEKQVRTFIDYGFSGFPEMLPAGNGKSAAPGEIILPKGKVSTSYLLPQVEKIAMQVNLREQRTLGFVVALAYFLDGHVEYCVREEDRGRFLSHVGSYEPNFYKSLKSPKDCADNIEAVSRIYVPKNPEAVMILQEISGDGRNLCFQLIHTAKAKPATGKLASKLRLLDACMNYLQTFQGREEFSEKEINEIMAIFELFSVLDPKGKYVNPGDRAFSELAVNSAVKTKILPFKEQKNDKKD